LANLVASVADPHHFDADPDADLDPTFHFDEDLDLDPACNIDADPNPDPSFHFVADWERLIASK
jgi:hypothetical protein